MASAFKVGPVYRVGAVACDDVWVKLADVIDEFFDDGFVVFVFVCDELFCLRRCWLTVEIIRTGFRSGLGEPSRL